MRRRQVDHPRKSAVIRHPRSALGPRPEGRARGTLGGSFSVGRAVNASGQVAGGSTTAGDAALTHAFLYSDGQLLDLNDLISPGSGLLLLDAAGLSDHGYITGTALAPDGLAHAFLLTPVPEPSSLVLLGTGGVGLLGYGAWRWRTVLRPSIG